MTSLTSKWHGWQLIDTVDKYVMLVLIYMMLLSFYASNKTESKVDMKKAKMVAFVYYMIKSKPKRNIIKNDQLFNLLIPHKSILPWYFWLLVTRQASVGAYSVNVWSDGCLCRQRSSNSVQLSISDLDSISPLTHAHNIHFNSLSLLFYFIFFELSDEIAVIVMPIV